MPEVEKSSPGLCCCAEWHAELGRTQWGLLTLALAIFMAGHWRALVSLLVSVSRSSVCTVAAAGCVAAALWPVVTARCQQSTASAVGLGWQVWSIVDGLILAIFKLPECARDIKHAVQEIREVGHTLKSIKAKIAFLPGEFRPPADVAGLDNADGLVEDGTQFSK